MKLTEAMRKELEALKALPAPTEDELKRIDELEAKEKEANEKVFPESYVKKLRAESANYRQKAKELEERLLDFDGIDLDKIRQQQEEAKKLEEEALLKKGEWEKVKQKMLDQHAKDIKAKDDEIAKAIKEREKLEDELTGFILSKEVSLAAASAEAINPRVVEMIAKAQCYVETDEEGARWVFVRDEAGDRRIDPKTAKPLTPGQLIEEMKLSEDYAHLFRGGSSGADSGTSVHRGQRIKNPWKKESFNLTEQGRIFKENPSLAERLKREAR